jgi:MFS family permease
MFALAPIAGWASDRFGRIPTIALGGITLVVATILTALAGEAPEALMFPGLFLLGLGWSFGIVAGSALLTESVDLGDRVAVQGAADLATNVPSGAGALVSGLVLSMSGFHTLSFIGMAAAGGLLVHAFFEYRLSAARAAI